MKKPENKDIKRILVVKNDHIGDLVLSSCAFRELKKNFPKSEITVVASSINKPLIEKNPHIDEILVIERGKEFLKSFWKYPFFWKEIYKKKFDIGINLRGSGDILNFIFLMYLPRIKYKIGFGDTLSKFFLDYTQRVDYNKHESKLSLNLINGGLNLNLTNNFPEIYTSREDLDEANKFIEENELKKYISIVPETGDEGKQWSLENFNETIKYLQWRYPEHKIVLIGSDETKLDWLIERNPKLIKMANYNLRIVYLILKKSNLVISLDVGPMHLAWAGNANLIAIIKRFNSINVENIRPLSKNAYVLLEDNGEIKTNEVKNLIDKILNK
ncbi:MAG: glycosyltransferase family 9 protein [archaeon]